MTVSAAKQQIIETILAPIASDDTDMVRRDIRALNRQGILGGLIEEAARRNLSVLQIGRYLAFFHTCKPVWIRNPQPVKVMTPSS